MSGTRYTIPETAAAIPWATAPQIRRWEPQRYQAYGPGKDEFSEGRGSDALLSQETVLAIAIASRLVELGVSPSYALPAAMGFAHIGGEGSGAFEVDREKAESRMRYAGKTFPEGETWILVAGQDSAVVNVHDPKNADHQFRSLQSAIADFQKNLCADKDPYLRKNKPVTVMLLDGFPEMIEQRIKETVPTIRAKNTRLKKSSALEEVPLTPERREKFEQLTGRINDRHEAESQAQKELGLDNLSRDLTSDERLQIKLRGQELLGE